MIAVLGSVNMDMVLRVPRLPGQGETLLGREFIALPGGKGANQAVAAARLGAAVSFIGCVGDDGFGRAARAALDAEGIDTRHLRTLAGTATGVAMIFVDEAGHNCIGLSAGANAALTIADVDAAAASIVGASVLVCQLESPLPVVCHAIELAHRAGVAVLLNPAPAQRLPADLAPMVTWLVPNESEAAILAALPICADSRSTMQGLAALGYATVIATLGERGVCLASGGTTTTFEAHRVLAIDSTGAGDTFTGALAVASSEGLDVTAAIGFAQRAAAISVTRNGAMASMPRRAEINAS